MALIFVRLKLPDMGRTKAAGALPTDGSAWKQRHLVLGAVGIFFLYVGAEVSIGSFLAMYIALPEIGNMSTAQSSHYIAWYFGGAMVGRFLGAAIMQRISGEKVLMFNALAAVLLLITTMSSSGVLAMWVTHFYWALQLNYVPNHLQLGAAELRR